MIQNCKLKLVFKSKKSEQLFQAIHSHRKSDISASKGSPLKPNRPKQQYETLGIKSKIINELQTPIQNFKNQIIANNICTPLETFASSEFEYCYTFQSSVKHPQQKQPLLCRGKQVQRSLSPTKSRISSRQFSSKQLTSRTTSTSEYLTHRKTGYVPVQPFERSKIFTMNPFDYERIYMKKLKVSLDFYYKVQFANRVSVPLTLSRQVSQKRYRVYVGKGNNQFLVQETLRKRFWYDIVYEPKDCDLYWTQPHQNQIHNIQPSLQRNRRPKFVFSSQFDRIKNEQRNNSNQNCKKQNSLILSNQDCQIIQELMKDKGYDFIYPELFHPIITNHIPNSEILNQPKSILKLLQDHFEKNKGCDPWNIYPKTYLINNPTRADMHFYTFTVLQNKKKLWIIKPGQRNNNQNGVEILPASKIMEYLRKTLKDGDGVWTFLLQEYIERPLLYKGRKFDLHHFILITIIGGGMRVYWYYQGYVRLSSEPYTLKKLDPFIHFTSSSIQQKNPNYSHHQLGNKLSYNDFERYLNSLELDEPISFSEDVIPKMKQITLQLIQSCYKLLDPSRKGCNFQLVGLDFLLNREGKAILTGVNTNPSLDWDNPVIGKIVPSVVDQALELIVDPLLPPTSHFPAGQRLKLGADPLYSLKFQCIFDQFNMKS